MLPMVVAHGEALKSLSLSFGDAIRRSSFMSPSVEDKLLSAANNVFLLLIARVAMVSTPFITALLVYLGSFYLEARFDQARSAVADMDQRLRVVQAQAQAATATAVESNKQLALTQQSVQTNEAVNAGWRGSVNSRLDKTTDAVSGLTAAVAALDATVRAMR